MIKAILFDLDGVLVDACEWHYKTLNKALEKYNKPIISRKDHENKFNGLSTKVKLNMLGINGDLATKIWQQKQDSTWETIHKYAKSMPIKHILFNFLKKRGYKIACVTNAIRKSAELMLRRTGQLKYFDFIISNEDVDKNKPHPDCYLLAMKKYKISKEECLIVEDSPKGIEAAIKSGAHILKVRDTNDVNVCNVIKKLNELGENLTMTKDLNVLIPMAGAGSRFAKAGYSFPKPLIEVHGKPMIQVVTQNINLPESQHIYICQEKHYNQYALKYTLNLIQNNCKIIQVKELTEGAACTTLLAKEIIDDDKPLLIVNSDQFIEWDSEDFIQDCIERNLDGSILTFESTHPKWSFVKLDQDGHVTEVAEKKPISNKATVGVYYWKSGKDYVKYAESMIEKGSRVNGEFYVCPVYHEAILDGKKIGAYDIKRMWGLGTPEDLSHFLKNCEV